MIYSLSFSAGIVHIHIIFISGVRLWLAMVSVCVRLPLIFASNLWTKKCDMLCAYSFRSAAKLKAISLLPLPLPPRLLFLTEFLAGKKGGLAIEED